MHTLRRSFEHVYMYLPYAYRDGIGPGTYAIAATNKPIDIELFNAYILIRGQNLIAGELTELEDLPRVVPVQEPVFLTDDYVPVDNMLAPLFSNR